MCCVYFLHFIFNIISIIKQILVNLLKNSSWLSFLYITLHIKLLENMDKDNYTHQRIAWIDVMKGFLFTLVVLGHFLTTLPTPEFLVEVYDFFSPFRMPAYFFISGLLFSTRRLKTYFLYIKSKSQTLLLPYKFVYCFFIIGLEYLF